MAELYGVGAACGEMPAAGYRVHDGGNAGAQAGRAEGAEVFLRPDEPEGLPRGACRHPERPRLRQGHGQRNGSLLRPFEGAYDGIRRSAVRCAGIACGLQRLGSGGLRHGGLPDYQRGQALRRGLQERRGCGCASRGQFPDEALCAGRSEALCADLRRFYSGHQVYPSCSRTQAV